ERCRVTPAGRSDVPFGGGGDGVNLGGGLVLSGAARQRCCGERRYGAKCDPTSASGCHLASILLYCKLVGTWGGNVPFRLFTRRMVFCGTTIKKAFNSGSTRVRFSPVFRTQHAVAP
ncbi:MAG: hypothetical protein ABIQ06_02710, partial [Caldimonas sp.]